MDQLKFEKFDSQNTLLYRKALAIRKRVFIEEQGVPIELEIDEHESGSIHVVAFEGEVPVASGRFRKIPSGYKVERVATLPSFRGKGIAAQMMLFIEDEIFATDSRTTIFLNAQIDALNFYTRLGYLPQGNQFEEAGIIHIQMKKMSPCK